MSSFTSSPRTCRPPRAYCSSGRRMAAWPRASCRSRPFSVRWLCSQVCHTCQALRVSCTSRLPICVERAVLKERGGVISNWSAYVSIQRQKQLTTDSREDTGGVLRTLQVPLVLPKCRWGIRGSVPWIGWCSPPRCRPFSGGHRRAPWR